MQLHFKSVNEITNPADTITDFPNPAETLTDASLVEKRLLLPKYSFPGHLIDEAYTGLKFHFIVAPIFVDFIDFRLTPDNKYELLSFDDRAFADFTDDYITDVADEMDEAFDGFEDVPSYYTLYNEDDEYVSDRVELKIDEPAWCQGHYMRKKTAEELAAKTDDEAYTTDYSLPIFQDENGDLLKFICELYDGGVFGSYYLFFSPKTRLLRQFFQCT